MGKMFELLAESLTEIIEDMEKTDGKNLIRRVVEKEKLQNFRAEKIDSAQYKKEWDVLESESEETLRQFRA